MNPAGQEKFRTRVNKNLMEEIIKLRTELQQYIGADVVKLQHEEAYRISTALDKLIMEYYNLNLKKPS